MVANRLILVGLVIQQVAGGVTFATSKNDGNPAVLIDNSVTQDGRPGWLGYGLSLAVSVRDGKKRDRFDTELLARERMIEFWLRIKEEKHSSDAYLGEMVTVRDAGHLREYVWTFFRTPAWGAPPEGLKLKEFLSWRADHLQNHKPKTLAAIQLPNPEKPVSAWSRDRKTDAFTHYYSGYCFPRRAGLFERGDLHDFDKSQRDVSVAYNARQPFALTAYVYPLGSPVSEATDSLDAEFKRRKDELQEMHRGAQLVSEGQRSLSMQGKSLEGVEALFELTDEFEGKRQLLHSRLVICVDGDNFFKVRMTYPQAMDERAAEALDGFLRDFHAP